MNKVRDIVWSVKELLSKEGLVVGENPDIGFAISDLGKLEIMKAIAHSTFINTDLTPEQISILFLGEEFEICKMWLLSEGKLFRQTSEHCGMPSKDAHGKEISNIWTGMYGQYKFVITDIYICKNKWDRKITVGDKEVSNSVLEIT